MWHGYLRKCARDGKVRGAMIEWVEHVKVFSRAQHEEAEATMAHGDEFGKYDDEAARRLSAEVLELKWFDWVILNRDRRYVFCTEKKDQQPALPLFARALSLSLLSLSLSRSLSLSPSLCPVC